MEYGSRLADVFDGFIVILSLVDLVLFIQGAGGGSGLSVLRAFRLVRVFKLVRFFPSLNKQLVVLTKSLGGAINFLVILMLFLFIFTILGMYSFGGKLRYIDEDGVEVSERKNFDNLVWSFITVFQVLTVCDWPEVMYNSVNAVGIWAPAYYIAIIIMGQWILCSLFIAILLEGFTRLQQDEEEALLKQLDEFKQKSEWGFKKIKLLAVDTTKAKVADFFQHWADTASFKRTAGFALGGWKVPTLEGIRLKHGPEWGYWAIVKMIQGKEMNFRDECFTWWKLVVHDQEKAAALQDEDSIVVSSGDRYAYIMNADGIYEPTVKDMGVLEEERRQRIIKDAQRKNSLTPEDAPKLQRPNTAERQRIRDEKAEEIIQARKKAREAKPAERKLHVSDVITEEDRKQRMADKEAASKEAHDDAMNKRERYKAFKDPVMYRAKPKLTAHEKQQELAQEALDKKLTTIEDRKQRMTKLSEGEELAAAAQREKAREKRQEANKKRKAAEDEKSLKKKGKLEQEAAEAEAEAKVEENHTLIKIADKAKQELEELEELEKDYEQSKILKVIEHEEYGHSVEEKVLMADAMRIKTMIPNGALEYEVSEATANLKKARDQLKFKKEQTAAKRKAAGLGPDEPEEEIEEIQVVEEEEAEEEAPPELSPEERAEEIRQLQERMAQMMREEAIQKKQAEDAEERAATAKARERASTMMNSFELLEAVSGVTETTEVEMIGDGVATESGTGTGAGKGWKNAMTELQDKAMSSWHSLSCVSVMEES